MREAHRRFREVEWQGRIVRVPCNAPTPQEIDERCKAVQETWSPSERVRRLGKDPNDYLRVPVCHNQSPIPALDAVLPAIPEAGRKSDKGSPAG